MTTIEILAVAALRRWCYDRTRMKRGQTMSWKADGWQQRDARLADARIVRCVDFERVFGRLPETTQVMLLLAHRDGHSPAQLPEMSGTDYRVIKSYLADARSALGQMLDAEDLL